MSEGAPVSFDRPQSFERGVELASLRAREFSSPVVVDHDADILRDVTRP